MRGTLLYHMIHAWVALTQDPEHDCTSHPPSLLAKALDVTNKTDIPVNLANNFIAEGGDNGVVWPVPNRCAKYSAGVTRNENRDHAIQAAMDAKAWFITDWPPNHQFQQPKMTF